MCWKSGNADCLARTGRHRMVHRVTHALSASSLLFLDPCGLFLHAAFYPDSTLPLTNALSASSLLCASPTCGLSLHAAVDFQDSKVRRFGGSGLLMHSVLPHCYVLRPADCPSTPRSIFGFEVVDALSASSLLCARRPADCPSTPQSSSGGGSHRHNTCKDRLVQHQAKGICYFLGRANGLT